MLVDGQGNFGSVDGDNAAAMRYTEIRLAKIATKCWPTSTRKRSISAPTTTAAKGAAGIAAQSCPTCWSMAPQAFAVGMATNIPPHNLNEVVDACLHMLRNPGGFHRRADGDHPGAGLPTAGIIYGINGVKDGYRTGRGKVVMRASATSRTSTGPAPGDHRGRAALPGQQEDAAGAHGRAGAREEIEGISHIQDESDKSGMRLVIELKRGEVPEVVLNNLYKQTQLQDTFGMNMVALIDGQPACATSRT